MSDLSEQVEKYVNRINDRATEISGDGVASDMDQHDIITGTPAFEPMRQHYSRQATIRLRRAYRQMCGGRPFENPVDALNRTRNLVQDFVPLFFNAMADGAQVGQENTNVVKKMKFFDTMDKVYESETFGTESIAIASGFSLDEDLSKWAHDYLWNSAIFFGAASGFKDMEGNSLHKVWDGWLFMAQSTCVVGYTVGYQIGQEWKTENVLNSIAAATESSEEHKDA